MKTSNYILISFLIVFIGCNFINYLAAKNDLTVDVRSRNNFFGEILDSFSVVVAEPGANLILEGGVGHNLIAENDQYKNRHIVTPYVVRNDTLFVSANPISSEVTHIYINKKMKLKSLVAKEKSIINLGVTPGQNFSMKLYRTKLLISDMNIVTNNLIDIGSASIQANESDIKYQRGNFQSINLNLINSNFVSEPYIKDLSGSLRKGSNFTLRYSRPKKINLIVDKSSSCFMR